MEKRILFRTIFGKPNLKAKQNTYDCIVVCGYPANEDGSPSPYMKTRVDKAVALWKKGKSEKLIFSGGAAANKFVEAEVMKEYAMNQGIPEACIIEEKKSVSTYHNMMYVKDVMKEQGLYNCIIVTNGWHLRKADHYARRFYLDYVMAKAKNPVGEPMWVTVWKYVFVNGHMFYMMLRGYY